MYTVIQYFFILNLNDAQNKHDGEVESSVVVVDKAAYQAAGSDVGKKRAAIEQILMAGHYVTRWPLASSHVGPGGLVRCLVHHDHRRFHLPIVLVLASLRFKMKKYWMTVYIFPLAERSTARQ